ncbi:MAG: hypothetical protein ACOC5T_08565, partial [Elusimicrobiota bacterium]
RFNNDNGEFKALKMNKNEEGKVFLSVSQGTKKEEGTLKGETNRITFQLSEAEIALLSIKSQKML